MNINEPLICPKCQGIYFEMKKEATYLYTYKLGTPLTSDGNYKDESLPFLFDNRDKLSSLEYLVCQGCGKQYSCNMDEYKITNKIPQPNKYCLLSLLFPLIQRLLMPIFYTP